MARLLFLVLLLLPASPQGAELRLGSTHTLQDSGILAVLVGAFERASGARVRVLVAGTGQVMKYAGNGDVDVVFTHSRGAEEELVARGIGKARSDVMHNDFVIAGPERDPARVRGMADAAAALVRIRAAGAPFASRGDDSGTHKKELQLWQAAGGLRPWPGYLATGQGVTPTLRVAVEVGAYDLIDRATLRQHSKALPLAVLVQGDPRLVNEYAVTTLRPAPARPVNERDAERFAAWLASSEARSLIAGYRIGGERAFFLPGEPAGGVTK